MGDTLLANGPIEVGGKASVSKADASENVRSRYWSEDIDSTNFHTNFHGICTVTHAWCNLSIRTPVKITFLKPTAEIDARLIMTYLTMRCCSKQNKN